MLVPRRRRRRRRRVVVGQPPSVGRRRWALGPGAWGLGPVLVMLSMASRGHWSRLDSCLWLGAADPPAEQGGARGGVVVVRGAWCVVRGAWRVVGEQERQGKGKVEGGRGAEGVGGRGGRRRHPPTVPRGHLSTRHGAAPKGAFQPSRVSRGDGRSAGRGSEGILRAGLRGIAEAPTAARSAASGRAGNKETQTRRRGRSAGAVCRPGSERANGPGLVVVVVVVVVVAAAAATTEAAERSRRGSRCLSQSLAANDCRRLTRPGCRCGWVAPPSDHAVRGVSAAAAAGGGGRARSRPV